MKFLNILLKEGRKEDLKKKYSDKYDEEDLDFILGISDLQDFNHKYTDWVLKHLLEYADVVEVAEIAVRLVKDFDKYQKNLEKKDINQYLSMEELDRALEPVKLKEKERELEKQVDKIYEDDNFIVVSPKTQEASCSYGSGTKWCTTQRGAGHFERYTSPGQGLYYIIRKKGKQSESHYKVAVHINNSGNQTWWDSQDRGMNPESVTLFKEYFPDLYSSILKNYEELKPDNKAYISRVFNIQSSEKRDIENWLKRGKNLEIEVGGYTNIPDMESHAIGEARISYGGQLIDTLDIMITYQPDAHQRWVADVSFTVDLNDFEPVVDLLKNQTWNFKNSFPIESSPELMWGSFTNTILRYLSRKVTENLDLIQYVTNSQGPVWRPDRFNYGYTFAKNKGLINKLMNWLDQGKIGTKLDFLVDIGKLDKKIENGKSMFSTKGKENFEPSSRWRGHFASFFASAKNAGILNYRKVGPNFLLIKGPNFDAFKEGKLTAL